jgi:LAS superfamily LD-carboxypeptidase LdcB
MIDSAIGRLSLIQAGTGNEVVRVEVSMFSRSFKISLMLLALGFVAAQAQAGPTTSPTSKPTSAPSGKPAVPPSVPPWATHQTQSQTPDYCKIGSGTVAVPVGKQLGDDLLTPVSKRAGEMLAGIFEPSNLQEVEYAYTSPEIVPNIQGTAWKEKMRSDALRSLEIMIDEAKRANIQLYVHSGYRSYAIQCEVFNRKLEFERDHNHAMQEGDAITDVNKRSAFPGQSEHQLGAAVDLVTNIPGMGYKLEPQMETTPAFAWLMANAFQYGFVLSYPKGSVQVTEPHPQTGYVYEPWHWRYIGERDAQNYHRCQQRMSMVLQDYLRVVKANPSFYCH